ncbi:MAG: transporter permease [Rhodospirillales bacterium]|nr:transporter permease [Rhodospirillales bacterium]
MFLVLWQVAAMAADSRVLPTPTAVLNVLQAELATGELGHHLMATLARAATSFVIAMAAGTAIGLFMGRSISLDRWLDPWLVLTLNLPALVTIILCYVWLGLSEAAAILAVVLNKIPNVVVTVREGARGLEPDYSELAEAFRFGPTRTLLHVILPQLAPFLLAAARSGLAIIWKIVLVVELLGRSNGIGFKLHIFFQLFDVAAILAYTLSFVAVMGTLDIAMLKRAEMRVNRWRR